MVDHAALTPCNHPIGHRAEQDDSFGNPYIVIGNQRLSSIPFAISARASCPTKEADVDDIYFGSKFSLRVFAN